MIFNEETLTQVAQKYAHAFQNADPFPYIVIDNFLDEALVKKASDAFPKGQEFEFYKYENALEKKLAFDQVTKLPSPISDILIAMNSAVFIRFLEDLTGIDGIIPDPYYRGGGIHRIERGGKLDIHIDFNKHLKLKLDRRLNAIIYLNENWKPEYGGCLELWKGHQENGKHILETCVEKVLPVMNRLVVFATSEKSYHGHPEPLTCPEDRCRQSIATYYYTNGRPEEEAVSAHSTTFIKRPDDPEDPEIESLREKRNQGRLATNVKTNHVAN